MMIRGAKTGVAKWARPGGLLALLASAALAACSAPGGDEPGAGDGDGDGDAVACRGETSGLEEVRESCGSSAVGPATLVRLTQAQTEATLRDIFGLEDWAGVRLSPDPTSPLGFTNDGSVLVVGGTTAKELLRTAEDVAELVVAELETVLPCAEEAADRACAEEFFEGYGHRLFRRPLSDEELARYVDFQQSVAERSDFSRGIKWALTSMIQSPHAIYRSEIGTEEDGGRVLDDFELATQLAYMLTNSTPDEALLAQAASGALSDPVTRRAEAERLLSQEGSARHLEGMRAFFVEWLNYRTALGKSRDDNPDFAEQITPDLVLETRLFLDTLVFGDRGTFRDLMTADFSAHNANLSAHYGWGEATDAGFTRVARPPEQGMGILAQGSLLTATAHQDATSPTLRGLLFSERFLCMEAPPPPAVVPTIEATNEDGTANTTREKYELNHAAPETPCGSCHLEFEPWGYTFESFDEMGLRRATEMTENGEFPVDTAVDNAPLPDGSVMSVETLEEVASLVDSSSDLQNCFSGLLAAYMFSGAGGTTCLAEDARAAFAAGELSIYDYLLALVEAPHFSRRR